MPTKKPQRRLSGGGAGEGSGVPEIIHITLGLTFRDIPDAGICSYCGKPLQKEFLDYVDATDSLRVWADPTPGYGCTGCGLKEFTPETAIALLTASAVAVQAAGDNARAQQLQAVARALEGPLRASAAPPT